MAQSNIADLAVFRNQQIQFNEKIAAYLWDLKALMDVVLAIDFFELSKNTMHCYFSLVAGLIEDMTELNKTNLICLQN